MEDGMAELQEFSFASGLAPAGVGLWQASLLLPLRFDEGGREGPFGHDPLQQGHVRLSFAQLSAIRDLQLWANHLPREGFDWHGHQDCGLR